MKKYWIAIFGLLIPMMFYALPPGGLGPGGDEDPDNDVPIDGGISLLIAAGAAAGGTKLYKRKKKQQVL
jgi:hypothetical protein